VLSVKLLARRPMCEIGTLALDAGSRSSSVLARILLAKRFGIQPTLEMLPVGAEIQSCSADAILLIGDRAIHPPSGPYAECWDLGDQWCRWSELPFVFAMWVARAETDLAGLESALRTARDEGVQHLEHIAAREAASVGLSVEQTTRYLRDNLHFYLGLRERRGLELYFRLAKELGLVASDLEFRSCDCRTN
jgi:chorismate dehydratase